MKNDRRTKLVPIVVGVCTLIATIKKKRNRPSKQQTTFAQQNSQKMILKPYQSALLFEQKIDQTFKLADQKLASIYHFASQLEELIELIKFK